MKLLNHNNKLETNAEFTSQNFGIGDASVVIEILRNRLYEHKIRTLVQEYICNGRDAMREIGVDASKMIIQAPTTFAPLFKVRDFGPGISADRMAKVFVLYGASTKRDSNNQTGGFGIGAKSAWSYTDSFTIITHIDGVKNTYIAHTGVNNNGRLDHVGTSETSEANGTEIQIAVSPRDVQEFQAAIFRAIYFWDQRPVVKGIADLSILLRTQGHAFGSELELIDQNELPSYLNVEWGTRGLLVIDGVPYPINEKLSEKLKAFPDFKRLTKNFPIFSIGNGVVEVSASRESIADSQVTIDNLNKLISKLSLTIHTNLVSTFGKVKTTTEFFNTYKKLVEWFDLNSFAKFDGYSIDAYRNAIKHDQLNSITATVISNKTRRGKKTDKLYRDQKGAEHGLYLDALGEMFFDVSDEPAIRKNKRIREFLKTNSRMIILTVNPTFPAGASMLSKLTKDLSLKDLASILYVEEPKIAKAKIKREDTEFCIHVLDSGTRHQYIKTSTNTQEWRYVLLEDALWDVSKLRDLAYHTKDQEGFRICGISQSNLKMIQKDKNFKPLQKWLDSYKPNAKSLDYVKFSVAKNQSLIEVLNKLEGLKDSFLNQMVEEYKELNRSLRPVPEMLVEKIKLTKTIKQFIVDDEELGKLVNSKYPLLNDMDKYTRHKTEITFYMNAKFEKGN